MSLIQTVVPVLRIKTDLTNSIISRKLFVPSNKYSRFQKEWNSLLIKLKTSGCAYALIPCIIAAKEWRIARMPESSTCSSVFTINQDMAKVDNSSTSFLC